MKSNHRDPGRTIEGTREGTQATVTIDIEFEDFNPKPIIKELLEDKKTMEGERMTFEAITLRKLCYATKERLMHEPALIEMPVPTTIVGDISGQFRDLVNIFDRLSTEKKHGCFTSRFVFLGNYVDRGIHSLECIVLLFSLKLMFPKSYCLLRGNHETRPLNRLFGFFDELRQRYSEEDAYELYLRINDVFDCLPLTAIVGEKILCVHAGLSEEMVNLADMKKLNRPLGDVGESSLATDILWADPAVNVKEFELNGQRNLSKWFDEAAVDSLIEKFGLSLIVRSHQMPPAGFAFYNGRKVLTLFSAPNVTGDTTNYGAVARILEDGGMEILVFANSDDDNTPLTKDSFNKKMKVFLQDDSWICEKGEMDLPDWDMSHKADTRSYRLCAAQKDTNKPQKKEKKEKASKTRRMDNSDLSDFTKTTEQGDS